MHFGSFSHFSLSASFQFLKLLVTNVTQSAKYATSCHCCFKQHKIVNSYSVHSFISLVTVSQVFIKHHLKTDFARCLT